MAPDAPVRRPGRPVADAPIESLLAAPEEVARKWMFALLAGVDLHEAPGIVTEPFTRDGPRVCEAALRALAEESDLWRLERDGALWPLVSRVGEMTGSIAPSHVLRAVDALQDVLWTALRGELRTGADPDLVADLAARLTRVCALIRDAGLQRPGAAPGLEPVRGFRSAAAGLHAGGAAEGPGSAASGSQAAGEPAGDVGAGEPASSGPIAPAPSRSEPPIWVGALEREVQDAQARHAPLSLLLTELEDAQRIAASAGPERSGEAFEEFARSVRRALRTQDILVQETPSRAWVIARDTARAAAHSLGARIVESVGESSPVGESALVASVGIAVLGEDADTCAQLIEAGEEARFAASARDVEVEVVRRMR